MKIYKSLATVLVLLLMVVADAQAFDKKRSGFQLGLGLGMHTSSIEFTNSSSSGNIESEQLMASSFSIGYGFSNRFSMFIGGKGGSILIDGFDGTMVTTGLGGRYYFSDSTPSMYVTALGGRGSVKLNSENVDEASSGNAWLAGIGVELIDRLHLEASYSRADLRDPVLRERVADFESTYLTLQFLLY